VVAVLALAAPIAMLAFAAPIGRAQAAAAGGGLNITGVWARPSVPGSDIAAAYLTITNRSPSAERLIGVSSPAAASVEMHTMDMSAGMMRMRAVDGFDIPAGGSLELEPGGNHLMLIGLKSALRTGDKFELTLTLRAAGNVMLQGVVN
jgi:hypothetical protein